MACREFLAMSIAVTETETEEVSADFSDALIEIDSMKSLACSQCDKVCKSKGGLTRHTKSKHFSTGAVFFNGSSFPGYLKGL